MTTGMTRQSVARLVRACAASAVALAVALAVVLAAAGPAKAHAVLVETDPADGAALDTAPGQVTLIFNEPVSVPSGGLRVFDGDGERVPAEPVDTGAAETVAIALPELPDGGYVVTWRVLSADSHPVAGAFAFTVGAGQAVDDDLVAALFGGQGGLASGVLGGLLRGLGYAGTLLAGGALIFGVAVARRDDDRDRARRLGIAGAWAAAAAAVLAVPVQAAATLGMGAGSLFQPGALGDTLTSSFGLGTLLRVASLVALALLWGRRSAPPVLAFPASLAVASFLIDGHTRTVEPQLLMLAGDTIHLAAAAVWFGGLVVLGVAVRARKLEDDPVGAARMVARFSNLALWSVVFLAIGGLAMAWALVRVPRALTTTTYGWTLLAKNAAVLLGLAVAAYNRGRLVPAISRRLIPAGGASGGMQSAVGASDAAPSAPVVTARTRSAWRQLRTTLGLEVVLLVVAIAITGFLVSQRPAADAAGVTGFYETTTSLTDEIELQIVVDPNRAGRNTIHLYALDATGRPSGDIDDLRLELFYPAQQIGPFTRQPFPAGPGHWVLIGDELAFPGEWTIRVVVGLDRFTEVSTEVSVHVSR